MAASEVEICNLALTKVGNLTITALTDATKEARACKVYYPLMRNELLAGHPWNFAMKRVDLSLSAPTVPAFQWLFSFTLPADCLRVWELYGTDAQWSVEQGEFLTDQELDVFVRYIFLQTDSAKFSPSFDCCLSQRLAAELATKLADDKALRQALLQELYQKYLPEAKMLNAHEGNGPEPTGSQPLDKGNYSWVKEGHNGGWRRNGSVWPW